MAATPTRWPLADGRELLFFSLPDHTAHIDLLADTAVRAARSVRG